MASGFTFDPSDAFRKLAERRQRTMFAVETYAKNAAAMLEAEAKANAPWSDRTGNARQTITGVHGWVGSKQRVGVAGNMAYSPYLELTQEGKNAILKPTVDKHRVAILEGYSGMIKKR